jgi:formamidopyrimidine-DNA glycosylase
MPELPDVETFRRYFNATSLHQKTTRIEVRNAKVLKAISARKLKDALVGHSFQSTRRHGKYLFAETDGTSWLVLHFGMTGSLKYFKNLEKGEPHARLIVTFDNGSRLAYVCPRLLGKVTLTEAPARFVGSRNLGADALSVGFNTLKDTLASSQATIKSVLMNQRRLAGLGNIYADEILFQSGIHPKTESRRLGRKEVKRILQNMKKVLKMAINRQANPHELPRSYLLPHRAKGKKCPRCKAAWRQVKVAGRTTYFCPECQNKNS